MNYENGDVYKGEWDKGERHGKGMSFYASGDVYEGDWFCDKRHGFGILDYANGDHFEGAWVDDNKEGKGVHFYFNREKKVHTKRYDGEWVDDRPKCGAYTEMPPDPLAPASLQPDPLQPLQLVDAEGVLETRLSEVRAQRAQVRAKRVKLEDHFTPEELDALRLAFDRADPSKAGVLGREQLAIAFNQVGMDPSEEDLASVVAQLGKSTSSYMDDVSFTFADFAQAADLLSPVEQPGM